MRNARAIDALLPKTRQGILAAMLIQPCEQSGSDIDLMVIGNISPMDLAVPLRNARTLLGREINPTV